MKDYDCTRCHGNGKISAYGKLANGVCFKCEGTGRQVDKPWFMPRTYAVFLLNRETGKHERMYNFSARSSAEAMRCADERYFNASEIFRDVYTLEGAVAVRDDELDDEVARKGTLHDKCYLRLRDRWASCSEDSRHAVLTELKGIQEGWNASAYDDDTREDSETLRLAIELLEGSMVKR